MATNEISIIVKANDKASKPIGAISGSINNLGGKLAKGTQQLKTFGSALGLGAIGIGTLALKAGADMQSMGVSLKTAFGGSAELAKAAQEQIVAFAAKTPFALEEVMTGFIKLKNMGLDPSKEALTAYGDTASAMGKSLNDMVEAVADAATGEFERLKEFGIRASSEGDKVKLTFQGVTTEIGNNAEEIEEYLINLGKTKFAGGMEDQSKTLNGVLSTLRDTINLTFADIVTESGVLDIVTGALQRLISWVEDNREAIIDFVNQGLAVAKQKLGELFATITSLIGYLINLKDGLFETDEKFKNFLIIVGVLAGALIGISVVIGIVTSPIFLLGAAIVGVAYIMVNLKDTVVNAWEFIKEVTSGAVTTINSLLTIGFAFLSNWIKASFDATKKTIESILATVNALFAIFSAILTGDTEALKQGISDLFNGLAGTIIGAFQSIVAPVTAVLNSITDIIAEMIAMANRAIDTINTLNGKKKQELQEEGRINVNETRNLGFNTTMSPDMEKLLGFSQGGIVPGSNFSGDNVKIRANSGEMILTKQDQASLFDMIKNSGGSSGGGIVIQNMTVVANDPIDFKRKLAQENAIANNGFNIGIA